MVGLALDVGRRVVGLGAWVEDVGVQDDVIVGFWASIVVPGVVDEETLRRNRNYSLKFCLLYFPFNNLTFIDEAQNKQTYHYRVIITATVFKRGIYEHVPYIVFVARRRQATSIIIRNLVQYSC